VRESPALEFMNGLRAAGADLAFSDDLVDVVRLDGVELHAVANPAETAWDLVIVHTPHQGTELDWLADQRAVLDTTFRLPALPGRHVL
jgi:UDP-N-acetyl-D-glucosamine dehydrogenase